MDSRRPHLPLSSPRAPAPTPPVPPTPNLENFKVIQSDSNLFKVKNDPSSLVQPFQPTPAARVERPVTAPRASRTPQLWHIFGHLSRRRPESTRQHLEHPVFSESGPPCFQSKIKIQKSPLQPSDFHLRRQILRPARFWFFDATCSDSGPFVPLRQPGASEPPLQPSDFPPRRQVLPRSFSGLACDLPQPPGNSWFCVN